MNDCLLSIRCLTYNQAMFIHNALDGFVIQQTDFPFIAVIVDDASTDGEQEVIREYMNDCFDHSTGSDFKEWETEDAFWTYAQHAENKNCRFIVVLLKKNLYRNPKKLMLIDEYLQTEYIAICEGDDYWTDPLKLQKQVDFLEMHPDFSMCFHGADVKNGSSRKICAKCETIETREYFSKDVFPDWVVPTASIVYRREMVDNYPFKHYEWVTAGDIVLILKGMHSGRVWGMAEHMSVYRMNDGSLMAKPLTLKLQAKMCNHYKALMLNFPQVDRKFCRNYIASFHYTRFRQEHGLSKKAGHLFRAVFYSPKYVIRKFLRIR